MIELFIDTASSRVILAVLKDHKIASICNEQNGHDLSTRIFPLLDSILNEANVLPEEIDTIYVVNGPGSFTGVRIGVTIAKTMAWGLKKNIIPLSELELMATTEVSTEYLVPMIDARRNSSFAAIYDKNGNSYLTDRYTTNVDLMKMLPKGKKVCFLSYDKIVAVDAVIPNVNIEKMVERHRNDKHVNPHRVNPEYLKLTEAEENLKRKFHSK